MSAFLGDCAGLLECRDALLWRTLQVELQMTEATILKRIFTHIYTYKYIKQQTIRCSERSKASHISFHIFPFYPILSISLFKVSSFLL